MTIRVRQEPIDLVREFGVLCAIDILEPVLHETQAGMRSAVISTVCFWWEGGEEERKSRGVEIDDLRTTVDPSLKT